MKVKDHYDKHLGNFYSWMVGNFDERQHEQETFFRDQNISPFQTKLAFDLGAGHGLQSVSLARRGFSVQAVDFNKQLLAELKVNTIDLNVKVFENDILSFLKADDTVADCIVCMGDTLTHFESLEQLELFVSRSADRLVNKGKFVLSFRDLSSPLVGEQRFITLKSDPSRILTCFIENFPDHVMVHDVLHEKENETWSLKVSAYPKLKISESNLIESLSRHRLNVVHAEIKNRMLYVIAEKI